MIEWGMTDDLTKWEMPPGTTAICELPPELGAVTRLFKRNGRVVALTESGMEFIVPTYNESPEEEPSIIHNITPDEAPLMSFVTATPTGCTEWWSATDDPSRVPPPGTNTLCEFPPELGITRLFDRGGRIVALTESGVEFILPTYKESPQGK